MRIFSMEMECSKKYKRGSGAGWTICFALLPFFFIFGCVDPDEGKDDDENLLLGGLIGTISHLMSGHCATVFQQSENLYTVQLNPIPRGGCNQETLVGADYESYIEGQKESFSIALEIARQVNGEIHEDAIGMPEYDCQGVIDHLKVRVETPTADSGTIQNVEAFLERMERTDFIAVNNMIYESANRLLLGGIRNFLVPHKMDLASRFEVEHLESSAVPDIDTLQEFPPYGLLYGAAATVALEDDSTPPPDSDICLGRIHNRIQDTFPRAFAVLQVGEPSFQVFSSNIVYQGNILDEPLIFQSHCQFGPDAHDEARCEFLGL